MSKLTMHLQSCPSWVPEFVRRSGVEWLKWIDPPEQAPTWLGSVKVIGRTYEPDEMSNERIWQGKAGAQSWFTKWLPFYRARPWAHCWEAPNEPNPMSDPAFRVKLNEFTVELARLMHGEGLRLVGMNWSVGTSPDTEEIAKQLGPGVQACDYLGLHEYSAPTMQDTVTWHCLRYRRTVALLESLGYAVPPVLITECGIDGGVAPTYMAKTGWRTWTRPDPYRPIASDNMPDFGKYLDQLHWYSDQIDGDNVSAATIFTVCDWDWLDFAIDEEQAMSLADFIASDEPAPPPERARGIDISEHQNTEGGVPTPIDWQAVKDSGVQFVMIRASIGSYVDAYWEENYAGATSVGLRVGAYHYLKETAEGQAGMFAGAVAGKDLQMGLWCDVEEDGLTAERIGVKFLPAADTKTGCVVHIYTRASFFDRYGTPAWAEGRKLWVADWRDVSEPALPLAWNEWEFWQQTSDGSVPGIVGRVDLDVYNGTFDDEQEGGDSMVEVVDINGAIIENGWDGAVDRGARLISAEPPEGATVWRVKRLILDTSGAIGFRAYARDNSGAAIPGICILEGWRDGDVLPDDAAPRLSDTYWAQPLDNSGAQYPNRALILPNQFTNVDGYLEWNWGPGEFENVADPAHWVWVMPGDNKDFSDVLVVPGWWDDHYKYWVVFVKDVGDDDGGDDDDETGTDLSAVVEAIDRLTGEVIRAAAALEGLLAWLKR